jgi:hypothetical protein
MHNTAINFHRIDKILSERKPACHHFIKDNAHRPYIRVICVLLLANDLRSHVVWRASEGRSLVSLVQSFRATKVYKNKISVAFYYDIVWI